MRGILFGRAAPHTPTASSSGVLADLLSFHAWYARDDDVQDEFPKALYKAAISGILTCSSRLPALEDS